MFNPASLVTALVASKTPPLLRFSTGVALSVALLALAPSVQAADSSHINVFDKHATSCDEFINNKAKTSYTKNQSLNNQGLNNQKLRAQPIDCMLTQLRYYQLHDYQLSQNTRQQYFAYKAQAWLNYANHEDSINSRSSAGEHALQSGATILQALKDGTDNSLSLTTDIPTTSALMRPDLWAILSALKDNGGINEAPRELAFSEVALIWAAADHCNHGSRQSGAQFRMADRWLEQAREAYVNAHDSENNVALEAQTVSYYKQFSPLDPSDDVCRGQVLPLNNKAANIKMGSSSFFTQTITIPMPTPTATYRIVY